MGKPCQPQKPGEKNWETQDAVKGQATLLAWGGGGIQDHSFVLSTRCVRREEQAALSIAPSTSGCGDPEEGQGREPDQGTLEGPRVAVCWSRQFWGGCLLPVSVGSGEADSHLQKTRGLLSFCLLSTET